LMKPWDPPEQNLYPVLDDLLDEWRLKVIIPYEGIRVAGTLWSATSHNTKDFLSRNQVPYQWLDIEKDQQAAAMVEAVSAETRLLPVVFFPDGTYQIAPNNRELAEKVGMQTRAAHPFYDLAIIGAGPAGLAAAVYGASEGLRTVLIEREASGGQAGTSSRIENYLGFPKGITGADLARRAADQARRFGAEILTAQECHCLHRESSPQTDWSTHRSAHEAILNVRTGDCVRRGPGPPRPLQGEAERVSSFPPCADHYPLDHQSRGILSCRADGARTQPSSAADCARGPARAR